MISLKSGTPEPLVSVIIPAFMAEKYITQTLESVVNQSYANLEIIAVDDGSTDNTLAILQEFAASDGRLRIFQQENGGAAAARNLALKHASGEFVAPIDADDVWHTENVRLQVARLQASDEQTAVCYAWSMDIDEGHQPVGTGHAYLIAGDVYSTLLCHNFLGNGSCTIIRRKCLDNVGWYSAEFRDSHLDACEDWELYLRISERYKFTVVPEFLVRYRKHAQAKTRTYQLTASAHEFLLSNINRSTGLPSFVRALSCSSLYIYLAQQCSSSGAFDETSAWLQLALRVDPVTPLLRPDFYKLVLTALMNTLRQKRKNSSQIASHTQSAFLSKQLKCYFHCFPRLLAGQALHFGLRLVSMTQNCGRLSEHDERESSDTLEDLPLTANS